MKFEEFAHRFAESQNWTLPAHQRVMCQIIGQHVEAARHSQTTVRVALAVPPRCGKTTVAGVMLPRWLESEGRRMVYVSYSSGLASDLRRGNHPSCHDYHATGQQLPAGPIGVLVLDDPLRDNRPGYQESLDEWLQQVRQDHKIGLEIIVMNRWSSRDLIGQTADEDSHTIETFPALADVPRLMLGDKPRVLGSALWPERFPAETLRAIQERLTPDQWGALYQQRPDSDGA